MSAQPGWYPDPATPEGQAPGLRWWDGQRWSEHTAPPPGSQPVGPAAPHYAKPTTTPDGEPLASWGIRLGAYLIDGLIAGVIATALAIPLWIPVAHRYADFLRHAVRNSESGGPPPNTFTLYGQIWAPALGIFAIGLLVGFLYHGLFLTRKGATPGKLMVGTRVRLRERPGPLTWGTFARRWVAQYGYVVVGAIPIIGSVLALYGWVDGLWPLWDDKRQALHDKFAHTNVVRVR